MAGILSGLIFGVSEEGFLGGFSRYPVTTIDAIVLFF